MNATRLCDWCGIEKDEHAFYRIGGDYEFENVCMTCHVKAQAAVMGEEGELHGQTRWDRKDFSIEVSPDRGRKTRSISLYAPGRLGAGGRVIGIPNTPEAVAHAVEICELAVKRARRIGTPIDIFECRAGKPERVMRLSAVLRYNANPKDYRTIEQVMSEWKRQMDERGDEE